MQNTNMAQRKDKYQIFINIPHCIGVHAQTKLKERSKDVKRCGKKVRAIEGQASAA